MNNNVIAENIADFKECMSPAFDKDGIGESYDHSQLLMGRLIYELKDLGFFEAPASLNHHGNETGYLYKHSAQVTKNLVMLTKKLELKWQRKESPYLVGMLHDICKCDNYKLTVKPMTLEDPALHEEWKYNNASILTGHGDKSVIMALKLFGDIGAGTLTEEEIACIRWHMGAFDDKENWNHYGHAVTLYPNILWTHTADMMAARIDGI